MHRADTSRWMHSHNFGAEFSAAERRTRIVIGITASMMAVEILGGMLFKSMALLADGWHMSTHVAAFLITALAYHFSRRRTGDRRYSFGTGKMGVLGGFASAVLLSVIALFMAGESIHRFLTPLPIQFNHAIGVAFAGLCANLACALLLKDGHHHPSAGTGTGHDESRHGHQHHDLNLRSAYVHVLADALTSVTAIVALLSGKYFGWFWLDPAMGIVGSLVVGAWAYGLIRDTSGILLDRTPEQSDLPEVIRRSIESDGDAVIADLHVWQVGAGKFAAIVSLVAAHPKSPELYRQALGNHEELVHVTIEVHPCTEHGITSAAAAAI